MNIKTYIGLSLLLLVVIFIMQNASVVEIRLLFWKITMSRSLMMLLVLLTGMIIGWISAGHFHRKHDPHRKKGVT